MIAPRELITLLISGLGNQSHGLSPAFSLQTHTDHIKHEFSLFSGSEYSMCSKDRIHRKKSLLSRAYL